MSWAPKINRHCVYLRQVTVGANEDYVKRRPAVITGFADPPPDGDGNPILRVGRYDTDPEEEGPQYETYGDETTGVPLRTSPEQVGVYVPY